MLRVTLLLFCSLLATPLIGASPSEESNTWDASDKARAFVKDALVLDFFASPYGVGWNKPEHLHNYIDRAMETGITGVSATLAATYYTWEQFSNEYSAWRTAMMLHPEKFVFVHGVDDILWEKSPLEDIENVLPNENLKIIIQDGTILKNTLN